MHKDVILNRICYDRIKIREQTQHYQRLLETKPTLDMKPPRPAKKLDQQSTINGICVTKKERMMIDKNVEIQRDNRIMLRKLLEIDLKNSELNKRKIKPTIFKIRSNSTHGRSNHPQSNLTCKSRIEELKKITDDNKLILNKLSQVKSNYDIKKWEKEGEHQQSVCKEMSKVAGRFTKHPFFAQENPAATFYRKAVHSSSQKKRSLIEKYQNFCTTFYQGTASANRSYSNFDKPTTAATGDIGSYEAIIAKKKRKRIRKRNFMSQHKLKESSDVNGLTLGEDYMGASATIGEPFFQRREKILSMKIDPRHNRSHREVLEGNQPEINENLLDNAQSAYDLSAFSNYNTQQSHQSKFISQNNSQNQFLGNTLPSKKENNLMTL